MVDENTMLLVVVVVVVVGTLYLTITGWRCDVRVHRCQGLPLSMSDLWCHADTKWGEDCLPPVGDLPLVGGVCQEKLLELVHRLRRNDRGGEHKGMVSVGNQKG